MKNKKLSLYMLTIFLLFGSISAGDAPPERFSGLMFGDYYNVKAHHDSTINGSNGVWFRRIYFTYQQNINDVFSVRLRFEIASAGDFNVTTKALVPFIKDAYLKYRISKNHNLILGISEAPTFKLIDKIQGYRFLEKSPLDLQRWAPSRDFGVALSGRFNDSGTLKYHLLIGNGEGNKTEVNQGKKIAAAIAAFPTKSLTFEAYFDWNDKTGVTDWFTYQLFAAWKTKTTFISLQGAMQIRDNLGGKKDELELVSVFFSHFFTEKWGIVGRVDRMFDANPQGNKIFYLPFDPEQKSTLIIAGVDYVPVKGIHFTPNVEIVLYDEKTPGNNDDKDIVGRFTFFYNFK